MKDVDPEAYAKAVYAEMKKLGWDQAKTGKEIVRGNERLTNIGPGSDVVEKAVLAAVAVLRGSGKTPLKSVTTKQRAEQIVKHDDKRNKPAELIGLLKSNRPLSGTSIALLGEAHTTSGFLGDSVRTQHVLGAVVGPESGLKPMIIVEEGLSFYDTTLKGYSGKVVRESDLTACYPLGDQIKMPQKQVMGLSIPQRSLVVAGYILACLDGDGTSGFNDITLVFGGEHADIFAALERFAAGTSSNLLGTERNYLTVESLLKKKTKEELAEEQDKVKMKEQRQKDLKALPWEQYQAKYNPQGSKEEHDSEDDTETTELGELFNF